MGGWWWGGGGDVGWRVAEGGGRVRGGWSVCGGGEGGGLAHNFDVAEDGRADGRQRTDRLEQDDIVDHRHAAAAEQEAERRDRLVRDALDEDVELGDEGER